MQKLYLEETSQIGQSQMQDLLNEKAKLLLKIQTLENELEVKGLETRDKQLSQ